MEYRLSIGKVSSLTNISEKRLRYYDEQGLCSPAYRDSTSGYRYYTEYQIPQLMWISYLRALDLSVNSIFELLQNGNLIALKKALDQQVVENQNQLIQAQYRYDQLFELRQRIGIGLSHIRAKSQPRVISVVHTEPFYNLVADFKKEFASITDEWRATVFDKLNEQARQLNLITVGGHAIIYQNHPFLTGTAHQDPLDFNIFLQIKQPPIVPLSNIRWSEGITAVTTVHVGPYEKLYTAYQAISEWASSNQITLGTRSLEDYQITSSMTNNPEFYVTQLYIPLADKQVML